MRYLCLVFLLFLVLPKQLWAADRTVYAADVCRLLNENAARSGLPVNFLARLIWRESIFDDQAISPVGAEGIAQFMPDTAKLRGLKNSFDYREALPASADYLAFLREKFGNLGLAAAAYNFGEDGTAKWLGGTRSLPDETEDYVLEITGHEAAEWRQPKTALDIPTIGGTGSFTENCTQLVLRQLLPPSSTARRAPSKPWGVVIAGGFSQSRTLATFARVKRKYASVLADEMPMVVRKRNLSRGRKMLVSVMVGRNSRKEADLLCGKLAALGAACIVGKN
jgi:Transglycosylase SLT domain